MGMLLKNVFKINLIVDGQTMFRIAASSVTTSTRSLPAENFIKKQFTSMLKISLQRVLAVASKCLWIKLIIVVGKIPCFYYEYLECKRHTARLVPSTRCAAVSQAGGGGGIASSSPDQGVPYPVLLGGGGTLILSC